MFIRDGRFSFVRANFLHLEPVGSVSPKVTSADDTKRVRINLNGCIALMCPAQSFPVPVFR